MLFVMKFLKALLKKQPPAISNDEHELPDLNDGGFFVDDYLGQAANAGLKAREAMDLGDFDVAWAQYQEMSQIYLKHAHKEGFTVKQTLALVGPVHRSMARLLMQEGKHNDALVHILYYTACSDTPLEKELKNYRPFVNRCKFLGVALEEVSERISDWRAAPDLRAIRDVVAEWKVRD